MKIKFYFIFIFSVVCFMILSSFSFLYSRIPTAERNALIDLYNSTNGDSWTNNSGWKTPPLAPDGFAIPGTEGGWHGIMVIADSVVQICLKHNNLDGIMPESLTTLPHLMFIYFDRNKLQGEIPDTWSPNSYLIDFFSCSNQLTGEIPPSLGNLSHCRYLDLANNQLRGSIPDSLSRLNLQILVLGHNLLSGEIPDWIGNYSSLRYLDLAHNNFVGSIPESIENLYELKHLFLNHNNLIGDIPSGLWDLNKLQVISMEYNHLTGKIPSSVSSLVDLHILRLNFNCLEGECLATLGKMPQLTDLHLESNRFKECYPLGLDVVFPTSCSFDYNCFIMPMGSLTQTVAPSGVSIQIKTASSAVLSWDPILYQKGNGGYQVYYSTIKNDPNPQKYGNLTDSKMVSSMIIENLIPGNTYYFKIKTITKPYWDNQNVLESDFSDPEVNISM